MRLVHAWNVGGTARLEPSKYVREPLTKTAHLGQAK